KGAPEQEFALLAEAQVAHDMPWTIAVSQEPVLNPDYGVQGIPSMAIIAPDGTVRHVRLSPYRPLAEHRKLIDALLLEFGLSVPPS
ncbi:MAG TPA: hypothetical protein VHF69_04880, partial [Candidatus Synoicihabitans sp.]|nr:hypothetical protein [Candidatus Synoicihabitans sp.]